MVNIKIIKKKDNLILHRQEIEFEINHYGEGSPNRLEVRDKLAAMVTSEPKLTLILTMKTSFGLPHLKGKAVIYTDEEMMNKIAPNFSKIRNMPKENRQKAWKAVRAKRKK